MSDTRILAAATRRALADALRDPAVKEYADRTRRALSRLRVPKERQDAAISRGIVEMLARRHKRAQR